MQSKKTIMPHPRPFSADERAVRVLPVFLPHQGCANRCGFCAQHLQTGIRPQPLEQAARELAAQLDALARRQSPPLEVGFYGGTFTALARDWPEKLVDLAAAYMPRGLVRGVRCSTRPDALQPDRLSRLRTAGLNLVELGVQSFSDRALAAVNRGHTAAQAAQGCQAVKAAGLKLGIHLMPGLPGQTPQDFSADVAAALAQNPACVRLHPCLVLRDTDLAHAYRAGEFTPWSLEQTLDALADALLAFWNAGIHVIRVGLAPEDTLSAATLAGPTHPSLGQRAASLALFRHVRSAIRQRPDPAVRLRYPRRYQSDVLGWKRERVPDWDKLGVRELLPWDEDGFGLE